MTQHELARALRMPQPSLARIERGTVIPRTATLIDIMTATGHRLSVEPIGPDVDLEAVRSRLALAVPRRVWQALGRQSKDRRMSPTWTLRRLGFFGVPFVLIGELAEAAHGSPLPAGGLVEIVHERSDAARERIALALDDLGAARTHASRLRLLAETAAGDDYDLLARNAERLLVDTGLPVMVAAIEDLIRIREAQEGPEDLDAAAALRAIADWPRRRLTAVQSSNVSAYTTRSRTKSRGVTE